ncbi:hypothetical protein DFJ73DRAFT_70515 [Zopfochytrium polystomum]|nr:hypothetical protein DFJ73DRAFT_70515 [Zopfochytrium polystomum]
MNSQDATSVAFASPKFNDSIAKKIFPPSVKKPEDYSTKSSAELFYYPYFTWNVETALPDGKVICVRDGCSCTPSRPKILTRLVHDINHKTLLIYRQYQCSVLRKQGESAGDKGEGRGFFNTVDDQFLQRLDDSVKNKFPYVLSLKGGVSYDLFNNYVDRCFRSDIGLRFTLSEISSLRVERYAELLDIFAKRSQNLPTDLRPIPLTLESYFEGHKAPDPKEMTALWLKETSKYDDLATALMKSARVTKCE